MPCPFTGPKIFWAGPNFLRQTKNLFTYCGSHKHFVPDYLNSAKLVFVPAQKANFTEYKSSFCLAQNFCDCHNMYINFWFGTKNLDQPKTFVRLVKGQGIRLLTTAYAI